MSFRSALGVVCVVVAALPAMAQHRVSGGQMHERILAIVPMIGRGTLEDPKRPMFAPIPSRSSVADRSGIIGFHQAVSDDGNFALVEFVAVHPAAQVQTEFRKFRKDFRFDQFTLNVP